MKQHLEVIAEAGSNHNGDPIRAKQLIDLAVAAQATSIKFQFVFADGLYLPKFFDGQGYRDNKVFSQRKKEELPLSDWQEIWSYAATKGIAVAASVFCEQGINLLSQLGAPYVKIASTDLTNHALIGMACANFSRVIVSTGMGTLAEIDETVRFVRLNYPETDFQLMHCVSVYPCPLSEANTQRVALLRQAFDLPVGYSDHTSGNLSAVMAMVQGASFFEKHFTTDRTLPGFDHAHALEGEGLVEYVNDLEEVALSMLKSANSVSAKEDVTKVRARRGAYAARDLPAGHVLLDTDILLVRPSSAYTGADISEMVGKVLAQDVPRYAALGYDESVRIVPSNWEDAMGYWGKEMLEKRMLDNNKKDS